MEEKLCFATCEKDILQKNSVLFPNKVKQYGGKFGIFFNQEIAFEMD